MSVIIEHKLNLRDILPDTSYTGNELVIDENTDNIVVYYVTKYDNGKPKTEKFQPAKAKVPKQVTLAEELVEAFGMYQGDGQSSIDTKSYQAVRFANYEPNLITKFLRVLDNLGVVRKNIKVAINVSKSVREVNEAQFRQRIIKYWSELTDIPPPNFYKINWLNSKTTFAPNGNITLICANSSFRVVFDALMSYIKKLAQSDQSVSAAFLRGLIAADGSVYYKGHYRSASVAAKLKEDREFIRQLFQVLNIELNKDHIYPGKEAVGFSGSSNFQIAQKFDLFSIHSRKKRIFEELMNSYKVMSYRKEKGKLKILEFIKEPITVIDIAKKFGRKENAVRRYLHMLEKEGKANRDVSIIRNGTTGRLAEIWCSEAINSNIAIKNSIVEEIRKLNYPYAEEIRRKLGVHRSTISQLLCELEQEGRIKATRKKRIVRGRYWPIKKFYTVSEALDWKGHEKLLEKFE